MLAVLFLNRMRNQRKKLPRQKLKTLHKSNLEQIPEYCRTCLGHDDLVSIFYNRETAKKRSEDIKLVTGLEITMNDGLSQKICTNCIEAMNQALQFRLQSAKNDMKLRSLLKNDNNIENLESRSYFENNGAVSTKNNVNTEDLSFEVENVDFDENYYFQTGEDFITDHDYLEVSSDSKKIRRSGDQPGRVYKCEECSKEYNRKAAYRAHLNKHRNFRICEVCGKQCLNNSMLLQHKRARHGLARIHVCQHCDYTSATKTGLVTHSRRHTGERPYMCDHCGAAFTSRDGLIQHLPTHLTESNFECKICHKREKSKRLLQHHHFKVHKPKRHRYSCPVCGDVFKSPSSARHHLTASHGVRRENQPKIQRAEIQEEEAEESTLVEELSMGNSK